MITWINIKHSYGAAYLFFAFSVIQRVAIYSVSYLHMYGGCICRVSFLAVQHRNLFSRTKSRQRRNVWVCRCVCVFVCRNWSRVRKDLWPAQSFTPLVPHSHQDLLSLFTAIFFEVVIESLLDSCTPKHSSVFFFFFKRGLIFHPLWPSLSFSAWLWIYRTVIWQSSENSIAWGFEPVLDFWDKEDEEEYIIMLKWFCFVSQTAALNAAAN